MQVVKIQSVGVTIASGQASGTGTLSGFHALGKIVPLFASWSMANGLSPVPSSAVDVTINIDSTTQLTASRWGTPSYAITGTVFVVEFASDTTVQKVTWSMDSSTTIDNQTITAVTLANTFAVHYRKSEGEVTPSADSDPDGRLTACFFSSTTQLRIQRDTAKGACSGHAYVISSSTLSVIHGSKIIFSSATTITDTISSVTTTDTFIISSYYTDAPNYNDEGVFATDLQNSTTIRWRRSISIPNNIVFKYMIVTDSAFTVQRGEFNTSGTTDSDTITAVDLTKAVAKTGDGKAGCSASSDYTDGFLDGRYWRIYLSGTTTVNGQSGSGLLALVTTWEVVELDVIGNSEFLPLVNKGLTENKLMGRLA